MPTSKLAPVRGGLAQYATFSAKKGQPAITGFGNHDWTCSACGFVVLKGFDHSQYRIGKGVALTCGQCGVANEMPKTGVPAGDPSRQVLIEADSKPQGPASPGQH